MARCPNGCRAVVLALAGSGDAGQSGQPATWVSWLKLLLGAAGSNPGRRWAAAPPLAGVNPMNLLLTVGGAAAIDQTGIPGGQQAIAYAVVAIVGTLGVSAPLGLYFAMGKRSAELLGRLKDWIGQNNAVILSVLCLVIGMKLLGDALSRLSS
jgi:hypothetical protein